MIVPAAYIAAGVLLVAACGGGDAADETTVATSTTTTSTTTTTIAPTTTTIAPTTTAPEPVELIRLPLTGEVVASLSDVPDRPALAVKIDNHPRARPQAGLNEADIVFEENVEGITRFAVVFHSRDSDPVGPVRSGRSQDIAILTPIGSPLFAWSGGNAGVRAAIRGSTLVDLDAGFTDGYYRRNDRGGAPHNLYADTSALWASTPEVYRIPTPIFTYAEPDTAPEGEPATEVEIVMLGVDVRWVYDPATGSYLRFQGNSAHQTETSGQVSTTNIVVMGVEYGRSQADRNSPEAQTTGSGPVYVFTGGVVQQGTWSRAAITDPFTFTDTAGQPILLWPGRTWVELPSIAEGFVVYR